MQIVREELWAVRVKAGLTVNLSLYQKDNNMKTSEEVEEDSNHL